MAKKRGKEKIEIIILVFFLLIIFCLNVNIIMAVQPYGANVSQVKSEAAPLDEPQSISAQAGNVTELNIFCYTTTQSWQGYFGNVTGVIQLADAGNKIMYNWTLASPEGEVYSSTNGTGIQWANIQCFNFTAMGNYTAESGTGGTTNLYGTNLFPL